MSVRLTTESELDTRRGRDASPADRARFKYVATGQVKDPYDMTPDAYDTVYGYGATEEEAYRDLARRMRDED